MDQSHASSGTHIHVYEIKHQKALSNYPFIYMVVSIDKHKGL